LQTLLDCIVYSSLFLIRVLPYINQIFLFLLLFFIRSLYFRVAYFSLYYDSRAIFSRSAGISRSVNLSHFKPFSIIFGKRPAGAISDIGGDDEFLKYFRKLVNLSDHVYIASFHYFFCQRCARRYFTIPDGNFSVYFIPNERIRCIYCANINKKHFAIKFYYPTLPRYRADIIFINRFLNSRFL
jgi:hypothetical protein